MFDELNSGSEEQVQEQVVQEQNDQKSPGELAKAESTRALREQRDAAERRVYELERMMQQNMSQQQTTKIQVEDEDDFDIDDNNYVEGKAIKKHLKNLKQENKKTKQQFEQYIQETTKVNALIRLRSQFNDFDRVVNPDNLEKLQYKNPTMYQIVADNPDLYKSAYAAYELIKSNGIVTNKYDDIDRRIEDNKAKPRSSSNASPQQGDTPLARVGDYDRRVLTEEKRKEILRQSLEYSGR